MKSAAHIIVYLVLMFSCGCSNNNSSTQHQEPQQEIKITPAEFVSFVEEQIKFVHDYGNPRSMNKVDYDEVIERERQVAGRGTRLKQDYPNMSQEEQDKINDVLQRYMSAINAYHYQTGTTSIFN